MSIQHYYSTSHRTAKRAIRSLNLEEVLRPGGWLPGRASAGSCTSVAGTPDNTPASADYGNVIAGLALTAGQTGSGFSFGELQAASLAGVVFNDRDADGAQGAGEPGVTGTTITLSGTDDLSRAVNQPTTTGAGGS